MAVKPNAVTVTKKHYNDIVVENARLKELNREMVEAVAHIYELAHDKDLMTAVKRRSREILEKARGEGE